MTGGNRGLGLETCRQLGRDGFHVILTARRQGEGEAAAAALSKDGIDVAYRPLDVTDPKSIAALADALKADGITLDVLVNNAGVAFDGFDAEVARTDTGRQLSRADAGDRRAAAADAGRRHDRHGVERRRGAHRLRPRASAAVPRSRPRPEDAG